MDAVATASSPRAPLAAGCFRWRSYAPLALLRVLAAVFALAMVHPDEFFQSQEVMASDVLADQDPALRAQLHVPWEFALPTPNRSVLFPYLVAGLPYKLLQAAGVPLSGHVLLLVPRLLLTALSFLIDASLFKCAKALRVEDPMAVVLSFASSWPALVFLTRPFSNTFETLVLALSMATLLCYNPHRRFFFSMLHVQTLLLGSLLALGFFTRFTFPFFFFPLGLELVRRQDALLVEQSDKKEVEPAAVEEVEDTTGNNESTPSVSGKRTFPSFFAPMGGRAAEKKEAPVVERKKAQKNGSVPTLPGKKEPWDYTKTTGAMDVQIRKAQASALLKRRVARAISIGVQGLFSFLFWSTAIIALDTWYFNDKFPETIDEVVASAIIAPWNNLKYNLDPANLELHGVHPRITHALVNMPMLFGPLFVVFLINLKTAKQRVWQVSCVLVPLTLISLAPHQEPRFLLPLLVPLHLFHGASAVDTRWKQAVWGIFSGALAIFFGVLHQGGLLPLLLSLSSGGSPALLTLPFTGCRFVEELSPVNNMPIVFYKTYMPPRFALANAEQPWGSNFRVLDLAGGDAMQTQLYDQGLASLGEFLLVAPASVDIAAITTAFGASAAEAQPPVVGTCFPHVSTEDLDWEKPMELVIYRWTKPSSFVARLWEATTSVFTS